MNFIEAINSEIASLEVKLQELKRVRALYAGQETASNENVLPKSPNLVPRGRKSSGITEKALEQTEALLVLEGRPIKTIEILNYLNSVGVVFGGENPQNALSSVLSRSNRFLSTKVGWTIAPRTSGSAIEETNFSNFPASISEGISPIENPPPKRASGLF